MCGLLLNVARCNENMSNLSTLTVIYTLQFAFSVRRDQKGPAILCIFLIWNIEFLTMS